MPTAGASASLKVVQRACEPRARKARARQRRLLVAACARRVQHLVPWPALHKLVDLGERVAEGTVWPSALRGKRDTPTVRELLAQAADENNRPLVLAAHVCSLAAMPSVSPVVANVSLSAAWQAEWLARLGEDDSLPPRGKRARRRAFERAWLALLDDVLPEPAPAFTPESGWRTPLVAALTANVIEDRDYTLTPVLADALEDAGCSCVELLDHLRWHPLHVRGCWALERLRGRHGPSAEAPSSGRLPGGAGLAGSFGIS